MGGRSICKELKLRIGAVAFGIFIWSIKLDLYNKITEIKTNSETDNVFIKTYDDGRVRGLEIAIELINKII